MPLRPLALLVLLLLAAVPAARAQPVRLADVPGAGPWTTVATDGVRAQVTEENGRLRLDVAFSGGGYAIARRAVPLDLAANYRFAWRVRAERAGGGPAPVNDLEFKLVSEDGESVWWHNRRRFAYPAAWTTLASRKRHIGFAWGPARGADLQRLGFVEFVVTAVEGGAVTVWFDDVTYEPLPPEGPYTGTPAVAASAGRVPATLLLPPSPASARAASAPAAAWTASAARPQTLSLDFGRPRELGGLTLVWTPGRHAQDYRVEVSDDGQRWETRYAARGAEGATHLVPLPDAEARHLRLVLTRGAGAAYALRGLAVEPLAFSATPSVFAARRARRARAGLFPEAIADSVMTYWTVTGLPEDASEALVGADGRVEVERAFSLEPFLADAAGRLRGWKDAAHAPGLVDGFLPMPTVRRTYTAASGLDGLALDVRAWVHDAGEGRAGPDGRVQGVPLLVVEYTATNAGRAARRVPLVVALRPFQVNPPWQWLNHPGGVGRVARLAPWGRTAALAVNDTLFVAPEARPAARGVSTFAAGDIAERLDGRARAASAWPAWQAASDSLGLASAAWRFDLALAPGQTRTVRFYAPLRQSARAAAEVLAAEALAAGSASRPPASVPDAAATRARWRGLLARVPIDLPDTALVQTLRAQLGYVLVNRDGPRVQPGSRSYERAWIRDGSLTSAALLRLGLFDEVRRFLAWYAPFQFESGRVPCCVDDRGADPTPEHDSHGQLVYALADYARVTGDTAFARRLWPHAARAVQAMDDLRAPLMTDAYRTASGAPGDTLRPYFGMLPASISHEGYSERPMHSYWDAAFALRGYKDAAWLARTLGRPDSAAYRLRADTFRAHVRRSFALAMAKEGVDYLPGSVELGDFDATSTTVFVSPGGEARALPEGALVATFERYWAFFQARAATGTWQNYTPYEWRTVGTFVRLGQPERAWAVYDWFMRHRRPEGFRHWAEVVWNDPTTPRFIGDMPHTWVGTDFVRSVLDFFAYEDEDAGALVVGAGLKPGWLGGAGVALRGLHTAYGPLTYAARRGPDARVTVAFEPGAAPPGGVAVRLPGAWASATVDGQPAPVGADGAVRWPTLPRTVVLVPR